MKMGWKNILCRKGWCWSYSFLRLFPTFFLSFLHYQDL